MTSAELDRLAAAGVLQKEPPARAEIEGLIASAKARLRDAHKPDLSPESRFDLTYNAAHALALAALRWHGYRAQKRYIVFQALGTTLGIDTVTRRLLDRCHRARNETEYQGAPPVTEKLVHELVEAASRVEEAVKKLVATS